MGRIMIGRDRQQGIRHHRNPGDAIVAGAEVEPKAPKNVWYVVSGMAKKNLQQKITRGLNWGITKKYYRFRVSSATSIHRIADTTIILLMDKARRAGSASSTAP